MIKDPTNENVAIDDDGVLMGSVRMLPITDDGPPPTPAEIAASPVLGYARPVCFRHGRQHPIGEVCGEP